MREMREIRESVSLRLAYRTPPRDGVRDACVFARKLSVCSKVLGLPVMPLLAPRHETEVKEDGGDQCAVGVMQNCFGCLVTCE